MYRRIIATARPNVGATPSETINHLLAVTAGDLFLLDEALRTPSLYDEAIHLLARNGLPISAERLAADVTQPTVADDSVKAAWLQVYSDTTRYWGLYELAEKLVDLETAFRFWRFRHVTTVERIIGFKTGTGGTAGVSYLRKMLDVVLFPELFSLRTAL